MSGHPAPRIVLASASASRRKLLSAAGVVCDVVPSRVDEPAVRRKFEAASSEPIAPEVLAMALAEAKALDVAGRQPGALVIGADQVLALGSRIFEKPRDIAEARAHLTAFRGRTHVLHSCVALAADGTLLWRERSEAHMAMRAFSDAFLDFYLAKAGDAVCASVGAYQLEGLGIQLFERIEGDYFTILGLPLLPLLAELRNRKVLTA
jgi:septum formation protein